MTIRNLLGAVVVLAISVTVALAQTPQTPDAICAAAPKAEPASRSFAGAESVLEANIDYRAILCTEGGAVYIDLFEKYTPVTVNNFVFLAQNGYYNNTTFHRVLQDFMAQAGDPTGTGSGGPGYQFQDEFVGFLTFDRVGLLAMANAGAGTNGSQFFVTTAETPWLDYRHTIFGDVLEGYDVVQGLKLRDPQTNPAEAGARLDTVVIITDATRVTSTFAEDILIANQEDFVASLARSVVELPPALKVGDNAGAFTTEEVAQTVPTELQSAFAELLGANNHEYRVTQEVVIAACTGEYPYDVLGYTVDAFASAEDAKNAYDSAFWDELNASEGFEANDRGLNFVAFNKPTPNCGGVESGLGRVYTLRGRYLVTIYGLFANEILSQIPANVLYIERIAPIFESELKDVYRTELR